MTVHVISVGTSLRDFFEKGHLEREGRNVPGGEEAREQWNKDKLGFDEGVYDTVARLEDAFGLESGFDAPLHNALASFKELSQDVQAKRWASVPGLSAELDTVRTHDPMMVKDEDLTILLSSDTEDGRACAVWTAIALARGDVERVLYLHGIDQHTRLTRPEHGRIIVLCLKGLDAQQDAEFIQATEGLGYLARLLIGNRVHRIEPLLKHQEKVHFHLTGGYRATVPYLIATVEWLRSLSRDAQAHILPENAEKTVHIPLRRMDPRQVGLELAGFNERAEAPAVPERALLEGYAYERSGKGAELTVFGRGMRILFEEYMERGR